MHEHRPLRVLLVEDDPVDCEAVRRRIAEARFECDLAVAESCAAAIRALSNVEFDVILLDYQLPDGTGLDVLSQVVQTPVVFITGEGSEDVASQALRNGAVDYLIKDIERDYLITLPVKLQNIVARQRLQENLRVALFAVENAADPIYWLRKSGQIFYANQAASRTLGYSRDELLSMTVPDIDPNFPAAAWPDYWRKTRDVGSETFESHHRTKAGNVIPVEISTQFLEHESDEFIWAYVRNISLRKRAENALRDSQSLYQSLVEHIPQTIVRKDLEGRITFGCRRFCEALHRPLTGILGRTDFDLYPTALAAKYHADDVQVIETGDVLDTVEEHSAADGDRRYVRVIKLPVRDADGQIVGVQGIFWDITDRRKAQSALRESEKRYRTLVEHAPVCIHEIDLDGNLAGMNPAGLAMMSLETEDEIRGAAYLDCVATEDRQRIAQRFADCRRNLSSEFEFDSLIDGKKRRFAASFIPITNADSSVVKIIGVSQDITERAQAERTLRENNVLLESRIAERTAELQLSNAELSAFAYSVSHDLRAPLRAMQGSAAVLLEDYAGQLDAEGRDFAERIVGAAERMDGLILDLLAYSRIGRMEVQLTRVDLSNVVRDCLDELEVEIAQRAAQITVAHPLPVLRSHRETLFHIIENLLTNGMKFVVEGGQPRVHIWAETRDGRIVLWIEDNGIGILPECQERIFQVFERLHGIESYPGTGIGLAIVRRAVESLGGRVGLESSPGEGSRFWVELPSAPLPGN